MAGDSIAPGNDVEAWCTRCRMTLNHRVIAMVGSQVKRVHCLTCGSDHNYHPPRRELEAGSPEKAPKSAAAGKTAKSTDRAAAKTSKSLDRAAAKAQSEWSTFMKEMPPDTIPRPYKITDTYEPSEYVEHPLFGVGRVLEIVGREKIEVVFSEGRKVLIFNRKKP